VAPALSATIAAAGYPRAEAASRMAAGEPHTIRLAMPREGVTVVEDMLRGVLSSAMPPSTIRFCLNPMVFPPTIWPMSSMIMRCKFRMLFAPKNGFHQRPSMCSSTKPLAGIRPVGCICHSCATRTKTKISKRKNPVSLDYYKDVGYLPEALLNFLGNMGFLSRRSREVFTRGDDRGF